MFSRDKRNKKEKIDPQVKDILILLGAGIFLAAILVMPGLPLVLKPFLDEKRKRDQKEWEKFNLWRLRQVIKRLKEQKVIEIVGEEVKITDKGKQKLLKFKLEEIELKRKTDGKWRVIIYDIANLRRQQRDLLRSTLKRLRLLQLQESVYLTPFVCEDEIEYLRQIFDISSEVLILKVSGIENEQAYKNYFGL